MTYSGELIWNREELEKIILDERKKCLSEKRKQVEWLKEQIEAEIFDPIIEIYGRRVISDIKWNNIFKEAFPDLEK